MAAFGTLCQTFKKWKMRYPINLLININVYLFISKGTKYADKINQPCKTIKRIKLNK